MAPCRGRYPRRRGSCWTAATRSGLGDYDGRSRSCRRRRCRHDRACQADRGKIRFLPPRKLSERENVVAQGAQARKGDLLISIGARLGSAQIAVAAECGYAVLDVFVRPRVAILTSGDELVAVDATPGPGQIRNSNAPMLAALVAAEGGEPWILPTAADSATSLDDALADAAKADLILLSGGVSAGKFDLVEPALERLGARFHFTGVRIQPGKPMVFGNCLPTKVAQKQAYARGVFWGFRAIRSPHT